MPTDPRSLGEKIVAAARLAAIRHIELELAQAQEEARQAQQRASQNREPHPTTRRVA